MKARLLELPTHKSSPPHCCIVSGRRDGPVVDFGELTQKAKAPDPRVYVRGAVIEDAAIRLLGMVSRETVQGVEAELEQCEAERARLAAIVAGIEDLSAAEAKLRDALGVSREDPGDAIENEEPR